MNNHPLYAVWAMMKSRCYNSRHRDWHRYGGRGIRVCLKWHAFNPFYKWAIRGWKLGLFLDREDNDGHYSPGNCRWVTPAVSADNRSNTKVHIEQARKILELVKAGWRQVDIAKELKVCRTSVSNISSGKRKLNCGDEKGALIE